MNENKTPKLLVATPGITCEGPLWDNDSHQLYYLDITGMKLHQLNWMDKSIRTTLLPQKAGCLAFTKNGTLLLGMEDGIYKKKGETYELVNNKIILAGSRFNDGKVGPDGNFYLGTILREGGAKFYRMGEDFELHVLLNGLRNSNGLDWSMDEKTLYHIDTPTKKINAFDFDKENGTISNSHTVAVIQEGMGFPDGMTIDTEGMLWVALWNGGCVIRINPLNGQIIDTIALPAKRVTCCAFAGEMLDQLIITTASGGEDDTPFSGCIFSVKLEVRGRLPYRMGFSV